VLYIFVFDCCIELNEFVLMSAAFTAEQVHYLHAAEVVAALLGSPFSGIFLCPNHICK